MKKLALLIAALFVLGTAAFAVGAELSVAIGGDASVTFTYDLDASQFGITNDANATLTVSFAANGDETNTSDEEVTGFITLKFEDVRVESYQDTTEPGHNAIDTVIAVDAARVQFGSMFAINVLGLDKAINYASQGQGLPFVIETASVTNAQNASSGDNGYGFELNLADALAINIGVGTPDPAATNTDNVTILFAGLEVTAVEGLTAKLGFNFHTDEGAAAAANAWGLGAELGYDLGVLSFLVGLDVNSNEELQVGLGVNLPLGEEETDKFDLDNEAAGVQVGFGLDQDSNIDINAVFYDGEAIDVLELVLVVELANLSDLNLGLGAYVAAELDVVKPWASIEYRQSASTDPALLGLENTLGLEVGVDITVIPLTTFTLKYASADVNTIDGQISFTTKVAF